VRIIRGTRGGGSFLKKDRKRKRGPVQGNLVRERKSSEQSEGPAEKLKLPSSRVKNKDGKLGDCQ